MTAYQKTCAELASSPRSWLVTGAAGFIGSHLTIKLLSLNQKVRGLDNFATGHKSNLEAIKSAVNAEQWKRFEFIEGDIRDAAVCEKAAKNIELISHQAALASVPRSIQDPAATTAVNVDGFVNILVAAKNAGVKRVVYASSSSVYGDSAELPKVEERTGNVLSPYALSKSVNEQYAAVFALCYDIHTIGLRYFNVFGPRQDPNGPYAAVLPRWLAALKAKTECVIFGDGETSRDFCFVDNAVQANILAATTTNEQALNQAYNVAVGDRTTLNQVYGLLRDALGLPSEMKPRYEPFRVGDIRHSLASIEKAQRLLGYAPAVTLKQGLETLVRG